MINGSLPYIKIKTRKGSSNYAFLVYEDGGLKYFVKAQKSIKKSDAIKSEIDSYRILADRYPDLTEIVLPIKSNKGDGYIQFPAVEGKKISTFRDRSHYLERSVEWIQEFHSRTTLQPPKKQVESRIHEVGSTLQPFFREKSFNSLGQFVRRNVASSMLAWGDIHGDYNFYNIFQTSDGLRIIDWEDFNQDFQIIDLIHLIRSIYDFASFNPEITMRLLEKHTGYDLDRDDNIYLQLIYLARQIERSGVDENCKNLMKDLSAIQ